MRRISSTRPIVTSGSRENAGIRPRPLTIDAAICSLLVTDCQRASERSLAAVAGPSGPSAAPTRPWHRTHWVIQTCIARPAESSCPCGEERVATASAVSPEGARAELSSDPRPAPDRLEPVESPEGARAEGPAATTGWLGSSPRSWSDARHSLRSDGALWQEARPNPNAIVIAGNWQRVTGYT